MPGEGNHLWVCLWLVDVWKLLVALRRLLHGVGRRHVRGRKLRIGARIDVSLGIAITEVVIVVV